MLDILGTEELSLKITGADLATILTALGEIPHKVAGPLEAKIVAQVMKSKEKEKTSE